MQNLVNGKMSEKTHVVSYVMDLLDVPPFICSPFIEGWIWSDKPYEIMKYIFDELISTYLINSLVFNYNYEVDKDDISFLDALDIYTEKNKEHVKNIEKLIVEYRTINDKLKYVDLLKHLININEILKDLNIDFRTEAYFSPLEASRSKLLKTDKFDYLNLKSNFD